jgi:fluoride exporter
MATDRTPWRAVVVVSVGGVLGSLARWTLSTLEPRPAAGFPWTVLSINVTGSLLLGLLVGLHTRRWSHVTLLRPFLGTGVLGGFTTFSAYTADIRALAAGGHGSLAAVYLVISVVGGLLAVRLGTLLAVSWEVPTEPSDPPVDMDGSRTASEITAEGSPCSQD